MRTDLIDHREEDAVQKIRQPLHSHVLAHDGNGGFVLLQHHGVHAVLLRFHDALLQMRRHPRVHGSSDCLADNLQPVQRAFISIGRALHKGRSALILKMLCGGQRLVAQHKIDLRTAHGADGLRARFMAQAGMAIHVEGLLHQAPDFVYIGRIPIAPRRRAEDIVGSVLLFCILFGDLLDQQAIRLPDTDAVIAAEAALFKGDQAGIDLFLHVSAYAAKVRADDGRNGRGDHKDHLRMIARIHFDQRIFKAADIAHDHIVLTHMGGKQTIFLVDSQLSEQAHAVMGRAGGAIFDDHAALDAQKTPEDAHAVRRRRQKTNQTHANSPPFRISRASSAAIVSERMANIVHSKPSMLLAPSLRTMAMPFARRRLAYS